MVAGKLSQLVSAVGSVELRTQQIIFSQDLNETLKATIVEVIAAIKKFSLENEKEKQALLSLCIEFAEHLNAIIYNLQNFAINLQEDIISKQDLFVLIGKLFKTSYTVQQSFNQDSKDLKHKLIESIQDINYEAADLLKIIKTETSLEIKKNYIDQLSDLLRAVDCIEINIKIVNLSTVGEINQIFDGCAKRIQAALDVIKCDDNKIVWYYLVHSINTGCHHMENVVQYLETYADKCDTQIHQVAIGTARELHCLIGKIQAMFHKSDEIKPLKDAIRKNVTRGCVILGGLDNFSQNIEVTERVKKILHVVFSNSLASGYQLIRNLENLQRLVKIRQ